MILEDKITFADKAIFLKELRNIATRLGIDPNILMFIMYIESNLNPAAVNPTSGATGLIQFMPQTATGLGTSTDILRIMAATSQLRYIEKYFQPYKNKIKNIYDAYLAVFYPAYLGKPNDTLFPTYVVKANFIFDIDNDQKLSIAEWKLWLRNKGQKILSVAEYNLIFGSGKKKVSTLIFAAVSFFFAAANISN